ncbi:MAG: efflux RND transporter periplasmic adaptor subunit, partial [Deltaproteobacteria bacterium]|nr:efflux RND transporter periplasmic adaptor subunit [Deltaproteobacteria bacterium]
IIAIVAFGLGGRLLGGSETPATSTEAHDHGVEQTTWTCSMHPQIRRTEPGACPICGMDLIPIGGNGVAGEEDARRVSLSERAKLLARIRTVEVSRLESGGVARRLLGRVDYDETSLRTVTAWIGGRIDRLHVSTTGERVKRGQVIATLYSPEVYNAHQDLIQARQQFERLQEGATPSAGRAAEAALNAARDRLRLLGVPSGELRAMEGADKPSERVRIRTPFGGTVIERLATQGSYVETGTGLYRVADLSTLWVQLDAYESDLSVLKAGQEVSLGVEALPGKVFKGHVTFVDPVLDPKTRTARVRIEVRNENRRLRPGMFVEASVQSGGGAKTADEAPLVVPATAPLFTGRRSIVYVELEGAEQPTYEARVVTLGPRMGDVYPVLTGLREGERVVIHGAFAIDADLQIQGGDSMMNLPDDEDSASHDPKKRKRRKPAAPAVNHQRHMQGHQH